MWLIYMNLDTLILKCPHCDNYVYIHKSELNCHIFRHGIYKDSFKQIINVISAMGMNDDRIIAEFQALVFKQTRETNICDFDFESVAESINLKDFYLNIQKHL